MTDIVDKINTYFSTNANNANGAANTATDHAKQWNDFKEWIKKSFSPTDYRPD